MQRVTHVFIYIVLIFAGEEPLHGSPVRRPIPKSESHDIGYSSESHSTDDPDGTHGSIAALVHKQDREDEKIKLRSRSDLTTIGLDEKTESKKSWRHSMTSAYDTSSNCSDTNCTNRHLEVEDLDGGCSAAECDGQCGPDSPCTQVAHNKVQNLINVPSKRFYMMTQVESTDSESPTKGHMFHYMTKKDGDNSSRNTKLSDEATDILSEDNSDSGMIKDSRSETILSSDCGGSREVLQEDNVSHVQDTSPYDTVTAVKRPLQSCNGAIKTDGRWSVDSKCVQKLIQEVELLVQDGNTTKWQQRKRKPVCSEAGLSTDLSTNGTEDSLVSSCDDDACTSISSGAFDSDSDGNTLLRSPQNSSYGNSTLCDLTESGQTLLSTSSPSLVRRKRLTARRTTDNKSSNKGSSITELYELTNRLDMSPFSISESAIYDLSHQSKRKTGSLNKLRRFYSDSASLGMKKEQTGKGKRRRKIKKSSSSEPIVQNSFTEELTSSKFQQSDRVFTSTPLKTSPIHPERGAVSKKLFSPEVMRGTKQKHGEEIRMLSRN